MMSRTTGQKTGPYTGHKRASKQSPHSPLTEAIGSVLRNIRISSKFTLQDLTDKTGISLGYLSQIELGKNRCAVDKLQTIAKALDMELWQIFKEVEIKLLQPNDSNQSSEPEKHLDQELSGHDSNG